MTEKQILLTVSFHLAKKSITAILKTEFSKFHVSVLFQAIMGCLKWPNKSERKIFSRILP